MDTADKDSSAIAKEEKADALMEKPHGPTIVNPLDVSEDLHVPTVVDKALKENQNTCAIST
jgi:hypothetical protein